MKIIVAEYASALGRGGTVELEGRAMLSALVGSFSRCGHDVIYPTSGLDGRMEPWWGRECQ